MPRARRQVRVVRSRGPVNSDGQRDVIFATGFRYARVHPALHERRLCSRATPRNLTPNRTAEAIGGDDCRPLGDLSCLTNRLKVALDG